MILPSKHIKLSNSLFNVGAIILQNLDEKYTVTLLWNKTKDLQEIKTFERFTLGLDFLFIIGLVEFSEGFIVRSQT